MAQGLLPEPQPQFGVSPEDLPRYAQLGIPPPGSPAYTPGPLAEEMLQQFPHESTFGVGLSGPNLFPTSRLGSTRPTRSGTGETIWTTDLGVEETPTYGSPSRGYYSPATGQINLFTSPDHPSFRNPLTGRLYTEEEADRLAGKYEGQYRGRPVVPTQSLENAPLGFAAGSQGTSTYPEFNPNEYPSFAPSYSNYVDPLTGHPYTEEAARRAVIDSFTGFVPAHEAAHRSFGTAVPLVDPEIFTRNPAPGYVDPAMGFSAEPGPEGRGLLNIGLAKGDPGDAPEHEMIYLQDWVSAKTRGDRDAMDHAQTMLTHGEPVYIGSRKIYPRLERGGGRYDILAALKPGSPQRRMLDKYNDKANKTLKELGRPPIPGYKDMINKAIGLKQEAPDLRVEGAEDMGFLASEKLMKTLQNVGRQ